MFLKPISFLTSLLFILWIDFSGYAQYFENDLTFNKNLFEIANNNDINLSVFTEDETRGKVVKFNNKTNPLSINSQRDKNISVAFWIKPQNIELHPGTIYGEENNFYLRYLSNQQIQFNHFNLKDTETKAVLSENRWQHIGFTLNTKGRLKIFLNGDCILQDSIKNNWWKRKGKTYIGTDKYDINAEGFLDKLQTWNRAISEKEMMEVYMTSLKSPAIDFALNLYLPLETNLQNKAATKSKLISEKNISFESDNNGIGSALFTHKTSYLKFENVKFGHQQTISLWVKPSDKDRIMALVGNSDFSLRYLPKTGKLWFSVPLNYGILANPPKNINTKEWTHLAISLNYNHLIDFYINGKKTDSKQIYQNTGKATYLEIGKSFWNNYYDGNIKEIALWDRKLSDAEIEKIYKNNIEISSKQQYTTTLTMSVIILIVFLTLVCLKLFRKKKNLINKTSQISIKPAIHELPKLPLKNAIYFLEKFRAYNANSENFSNEFAPTLIRLFLIILIYPKIFKRHISSTEMSEALWPNETNSQQKNNRSTNIHRLRGILKNIEGLTLEYKNKTWQIEVSDAIFIDILSIDQLFSQWNTIEQLHKLTFDKTIYTHNFDLLLRPLQDNLTSNVHKNIKSCILNKDWNKIIYLAKLWLTLDSLSKPAIEYLIKAQITTHQNQKALSSHNSFCKNHLDLLNKSFDVEFSSYTPYH